MLRCKRTSWREATISGILVTGAAMIAFIVLLGMMLSYGIWPSLALASVPFFLFLAVTTALAVSYWLSALDVEYRDVRYTLPLLTQLSARADGALSVGEDFVLISSAKFSTDAIEVTQRIGPQGRGHFFLHRRG